MAAVAEEDVDVPHLDCAAFNINADRVEGAFLQRHHDGVEVALEVDLACAQQLDAVGIDLDIVSYDWGTFYGDVSHGRFQLYGLSWVGLRLPDVFRYAFHSTSRPPAGANRGHYRSARLDGLVERAERAGARAARVRLYHEIAALLLDDLPYVPLWFEDQLVIMRDDIEGYATDASGSFDALATATRRPRHAG